MTTETGFDLAARLERHRLRQKQLQWRGNFAEYFAMVKQNPSLARLSHRRIADMIEGNGVEVLPDGSKKYPFFQNDLFGLEKPLQQLAEHFDSAGRRLEVRKRILLFMGPVGGGKSTIVALLKCGLEKYTQSDGGAVYAIDGCPMNEEPLHLIPAEMRPDLERELGIYIEGDLCPVCELDLEQKYQGRAEIVPVRRVVFSEKKRVGIGTFAPSDPKSQDITELTGSIDLSTIGEYGAESDPRAYRFDGELNIANRGLMEFIEMLKADEKFLYGLLTLSQEQSIKTGRFAMIYADEVVISHTNENEYTAFAANKKAEALQDRIIMIRVPYNLRVSEEVRIYEKLLKESQLSGVHVAPHTLRVASTFAILSRLEAPKKSGMTKIKKLKLYDGQDVEGFTTRDVKELQKETEREGMDGISPRYVINCLSRAIVKEGRCINPIDALRALRDGMEQHTGLTKDQREAWTNLITDARKEYDEWAKKEVQRAFVYAYEDNAKTLLNNYLDNVEAFCNKTKIKDPLTDEEVDPDEKLMRSIEEQVGITENAKKSFREEILIRLSMLARKGQVFTYDSHDRLREAIENKLFADLKDMVKVTTSTKTPDAEQLKRIDEVSRRLMADHGYCSECAPELLRYVGSLLNR